MGKLIRNLNRFALRVIARHAHRGVIVNNHKQTASEIRAQVEVLGRYFDFVRLDQLLELSSAPSGSGRPFCLLTFDDGKKVNAEVADELVRMGVPAVFYMVTDFIDHRKPLWFDHLDAITKSCPTAVAEFGLEHPKSLPIETLNQRIENATTRCGVCADVDDPRIGPLTLAEIATMAKQGFEIGAHTRRHAILTNETFEVATAEIDESIERVSQMTGVPCTSFAFPNGNFSDALIEHMRDGGLTSVMTTEPLWASTGDADSLVWPRIQLFSSHSEARMLAKLNVARFGCVLGNPDGTRRRYAKRRMRKRLAGKR